MPPKTAGPAWRGGPERIGSVVEKLTHPEYSSSCSEGKPVTPQQFLDLLWAGKPDDLYILLWTRQDKISHWFTGTQEAGRFLERIDRLDVYVGVGLAPRDYGPKNRCPADEIAGIAGLWADLDLRSEAHLKSLPTSAEEALSLIPAGFEPTITIATGNGLHLWWLFKEPWTLDSAEERAAAADLALRWQTVIADNAHQRGWQFEKLADLSRILRIPGTQNWKDPARPKPVTVHAYSGRRYNPGDFIELLDELGVETSRPHSSQGAGGLRINLNAAIPEDLLNEWLARDSRFRATWRRQRHDLRDQSQSGYDLALADFGARAGLTDQQIVDLIIHHRRLHAQKPRTRVDYYERTISKAREGMRSNSAGRSAPHPGPVPSPPPGATDEEKRRHLLAEISSRLGFEVAEIRKILGKEPVYHLATAEGNTLEFSSVSKLIEQRGFRTVVAAGLNRIIPKFKGHEWEALVQMMLDALITVDAGEELHRAGSAAVYLDQYLSETSFVRLDDDEAELPAHLRRKPAVIDGVITICLTDFQQFLLRSCGASISGNELASSLIAIGAVSKRFKVRRGLVRDQSRWLLPIAEFPPMRYWSGFEAVQQDEEEEQ